MSNRDDDDDRALIESWLRYARSPDDKDEWAAMSVIDLVDTDPDRGWEVTLELTAAAKSDWELNNVGSGPLETLIRANPERFLPKLESAIEQHPGLLVAVACVWVDQASQRQYLDELLARKGMPRL